MGYRVTTLGHLAIEEGVDLYFFVVKSGWKSELSRAIDENFDAIARRIGPHNSAIVDGLNDAWAGEILNHYFGDKSGTVRLNCPLMLITDSHPSNVTAETMRLVAPLDEIHGRFGNFDRFFEELGNYAEYRDTTFLDKFEDKSDVLGNLNEAILIQPNFYGFGVNVNRLIDIVRRN